jgi:hypothetical protein
LQSPKKTTTIRDALRATAGLAVETPTPVSVDKEAIAEGRKQLPSRLQDMAALRTKATEIYGGPTQAALASIDASFKFAPAESDRELNYLQVEPLLEHSSALLDRCQSYRSQRDELQAADWKLRLEFQQFLQIDRIADQEHETGADTLAYERAVLESAAEQSLEENHRNAEAQLKELVNDLVGTGLNRRMAARELAAWLSAYPLKDADLRGDDAAYTFDGARKTKPEHLFDAARREADQDAWEQIYTLLFQRYSAMAESEAARLRKESLNLEVKASLAAITFSRQREQAAHDVVWERIAQVLHPASALNGQARMAPLERNFSTDFREALACLNAAAQGLKEVYDYAPPLPQEGTLGYFDNVVAWLRQARNRLAQFAQLDQKYVLALSLKELTKAQWAAGRSASQWTFALPAEMFNGQAYVRLRGLSVSVVGPSPEPAETGQKAGRKTEAPKAEGFWSARVSLPQKAGLRNLSGATRELDQSFLPVCYLGCITVRDAAREPEIAGARVLHNASPIGEQWKLALSRTSTEGTPVEALEDVQLYLHLAVRGESR